MYIDENGQKWWKGNLHTHTTRSDGKKTPDEVIALYREASYDFLALTDHWKPSETIMQDGFLLLSGCEYDTGLTVQEGIFHIISIGTKREPELPRRSPLTPQEIVDEINVCGGAAILAHPAWSINRPADLIRLQGIVGAEIYNTVSGIPWNCRPYSGLLIDEAAAEGCLIPCMAADDTHFYNGDETKSFLMVKADLLTPDDLLSALRDGKFYATQGPHFSYQWEGKRLHVICSPVREVVFFTDTVYASDRVTSGRKVTEAWYEVKDTDTFVRFELRDEEGKMAWSSPISTRQK